MRGYTDAEHITKFMAKGYAVDTLFCKNLHRKDTCGKLTYWDVYCPVCDEYYTSNQTNLAKGYRGCACGIKATYGYVCYISDSVEQLAIKFGISVNPATRHYYLNRATSLTLKPHAVYKFATSRQCKEAESECKITLNCGIIAREDMPEGWTETTHCYNIEAIEAIYRKHGGIEL